jgi:hypothetical protein
MLNLSRLGGFKYDIREIFSACHLDENLRASFLANIIAKASRISTLDAKQYIRQKESEGMLSKEVSEDICDLLDRYSKFR